MGCGPALLQVLLCVSALEYEEISSYRLGNLDQGKQQTLGLEPIVLWNVGVCVCVFFVLLTAGGT